MPTRNVRGGLAGGRQGQHSLGSPPRRRKSHSPRQHLLLAGSILEPQCLIGCATLPSICCWAQHS